MFEWEGTGRRQFEKGSPWQAGDLSGGETLAFKPYLACACEKAVLVLVERFMLVTSDALGLVP